MTKSLQEIQKENRKFILEAIHGCSYEEALQKEWGENCIIEDCILNGSEMASWGRVIKDNRHKSLYANIDSGNQLEFSVNWDDDFKCTIIGKPITLNRVLLTLKSKEDLFNPKRYEICLGTTRLFYYDYLRFRELVGDISTKDLTEEGLKNLEDYESTKHRIIEVIGKPLTLSRVLLALKDKQIGFYDKDLGAIWKGEYIHDDYIYEWDLTKETLEEQSEETQRGINSYLIINK